MPKLDLRAGAAKFGTAARRNTRRHFLVKTRTFQQVRSVQDLARSVQSRPTVSSRHIHTAASYRALLAVNGSEARSNSSAAFALARQRATLWHHVAA